MTASQCNLSMNSLSETIAQLCTGGASKQITLKRGPYHICTKRIATLVGSQVFTRPAARVA